MAARALPVNDLQAAQRAAAPKRLAVAALPEVDAGAGHTVRLNWGAVPGATAAEVSAASAEIGPVLATANQSLNVRTAGNQREVSVPAGKVLSALHLDGLKWLKGPGEEIRIFSERSDVRLVISIPDARGELVPVCAVPPVRRRGLIPSSFNGASLRAGVLTFDPPLDARKVRLSLTEGLKSPEEWSAAAMELASPITATLGTPTSGLTLVGPEAATWWAFPGVLPADGPPVEVDLAAPLNAALNKLAAAAQPAEVSLTLRGAAGCRAGFRFSAQGALVRAFDGVWQTALAGDPQRLDLGDAARQIPLAGEQPASATADITVRYEGVRLLETVSDASPPGPGGIQGQIVTDQPAYRAFPPAALAGKPIARVGVVGRAPVACELSIQVIDATTGPAGPALGDLGVVKLPASNTVETAWVQFPKAPIAPGPVGLAVRCTRGRFLWAAGSSGPLVKVAIHDPDPGARPLRLNGQALLAVAQAEMHLPAAALPAGAFRSRPPVLDSDLFLTVDVSDLALRYRR